MLIQDIHAQVRNLLGQDQNQQPPEVIDQNLYQACLRLFSELTGANVQQYQVGNPVAVFGGPEVNATNADALKNLKREVNLSVSTGLFTFPTDCALLLSVLSGDNNTVEWVKEGELGKRLKSIIKPPTTDFPVYNIVSGTAFRVYPATISSVRISYYKLMDKPTYAYTIDPDNGDYVFDEDNSVDIPFTESQVDRLINTTVVLMGVPVQNGLGINVATGLNNR